MRSCHSIYLVRLVSYAVKQQTRLAKMAAADANSSHIADSNEAPPKKGTPPSGKQTLMVSSPSAIASLNVAEAS